jgi:hypothetical protein
VLIDAVPGVIAVELSVASVNGQSSCYELPTETAEMFAGLVDASKSGKLQHGKHCLLQWNKVFHITDVTRLAIRSDSIAESDIPRNAAPNPAVQDFDANLTDFQLPNLPLNAELP